MDINQKDRAALDADRCPDCGGMIDDYLFEAGRPWCKPCDVWFEVDASGWVIRNLDAGATFIREWEKVVKESWPV